MLLSNFESIFYKSRFLAELKDKNKFDIFAEKIQLNKKLLKMLMIDADIYF
jgi:hypothetical protein